MATFTGKDGLLNLGTTPNAVTQMSSWTLEATAEPVEASVIGDSWRAFKASMQGFNMSIEGYYDVSDTGSKELAIGALVDFELYPAGNTAPEKEYSGQGYVTAYSETAAFDSMVSFSASLQGTGALTETPVP